MIVMVMIVMVMMIVMVYSSDGSVGGAGTSGSINSSSDCTGGAFLGGVVSTTCSTDVCSVASSSYTLAL